MHSSEAITHPLSSTSETHPSASSQALNWGFEKQEAATVLAPVLSCLSLVTETRYVFPIRLREVLVGMIRHLTFPIVSLSWLDLSFSPGEAQLSVPSE